MRVMGNNVLQTIGYEGSSIEDFVNTLIACRVSLLLDIRDFPGSRKKGFSKNRLAQILSEHDIEYIHLKGLGDPKNGRDAARRGDMAKFRRIFHSHMKSEIAKTHLNLAVDLSLSKNTCLLCYERDHRDCHRSIVASHIVRVTDQKIRHRGVVHGIANPLSGIFLGTFNEQSAIG